MSSILSFYMLLANREEENHSVDAKDGEDIPSGTGPIQKPRPW